MSRTHDDEWDLASSVGATATIVAAGRAMATKDPRGLIHDPFAEPLVRAVGVDFFTKMMDGDLDVEPIENASPVRFQSMVDGMAVRTKYFDDYFVEATDGGVRQVVSLASGLGSRAYRLPWPAGTVVYEIDQPRVIEFKTSTLAAVGAEPNAARRTIPIDLRADWPAALKAAGFDTTAPTAWLAEGLLIYLPPDAQDRLFDNIAALSAPGSRLATEYHPDSGAAVAERTKKLGGQWREHGFDVGLSQLFYAGERAHVGEYLSAHGWQVSSRTRPEVFAGYGREFPVTDDVLPLSTSLAVIATRK